MRKEFLREPNGFSVRTVPAASTRNKEGIRRDNFLIYILPGVPGEPTPGKHNLACYSNTSRPRRKEEIEIECLPCLRGCGYRNTRYSAVPITCIISFVIHGNDQSPYYADGETEVSQGASDIGPYTQLWSLGREAFTRLHCCICYRARILATGLPRVVHLEGVETRLKTTLSWPQMKQV